VLIYQLAQLHPDQINAFLHAFEHVIESSPCTWIEQLICRYVGLSWRLNAFQSFDALLFTLLQLFHGSN
jgi:hypothetical protein